jgi:predicted lipoprotein
MMTHYQATPSQARSSRLTGWRLAAGGILLLTLLAVAGCQEGDYFFFYAVEEEQKAEVGERRLEYFKDTKFDADTIVADVWDSHVMPAFFEKAVDLSVLRPALAADPEAAGAQYGYREEGGVYPWNFLVKADARVVAFNTRSRKGTLSLDLEPYDGAEDATLWIGPIITSYSIRDALDFVSFTTGVTGASGLTYTFDTQVQFAEFSNSLNRRGNAHVLAALEPAMCFKVSDHTLEQLAKNAVPDDVVAQLADLTTAACASKDQFWERIQAQIGAEADQYEELIRKFADPSDTAHGALVRVYGAITPDKSDTIVITPVSLEILEEGQP